MSKKKTKKKTIKPRKSKTFEEGQEHPDGITGKDVVPDTHDHADILKTVTGPGHGSTRYIPGDGFLVSHGGFSYESKGSVYKKKVKEIHDKMPKARLERMHDEGTFLDEEEILAYAEAIHAHRRMTKAKSAKEEFFDDVRARAHAGTDAVDSAKDGLHRQSDAFDTDRSRSTISIGISTCGPRGMALNGSKINHTSIVNIQISSPDGRRICEVMTSPEQFAAALFGNSATPCTLSRYWSVTDDSVLLQERVRRPTSIAKRMEKRLDHRLKEQADALRAIAKEMQDQAESGKPARKTMLKDLAERVARATDYTAANAAFTIEQAREEISGIMESAAIQLIGQQSLDAKALWKVGGNALSMDDKPGIKQIGMGE